MRKSLLATLLCLLTLLPGGVATAQTCPTTQTEPALTGGGTVFGMAAAQWKQFFAAKVDANNGVLCNPTIIGGSGAGPINSVSGSAGVDVTTVARDATVGLSAVPTGTILANVGGTTAVPTPTPVLNVIGDTIVSRSLTDFGAACDGVTDDAAAYTAAILWMSTAPNRLVSLPAETCASSITVTVGDGRQQSTTLTVAASGSTITVTSISGILNGDAVAVRRDDGTLFTTTVSGAPSGDVVTLTSPYSGGVASIGNAVFTGKVSSYNGGGFVGYGSGATAAEWPGGGAAVSTIKYIGAPAPTTTLGATASTGATSLTVASIANIALGTTIGITLDNARVWWTWATETPTGTTVKIANEIPSTATSGNAVTIASNPVARISGPILSPVFQGVNLDANNLAAIGLEAIHPVRGKFAGTGGVTTGKYTAIGHVVRGGAFLAGAAVGVTDNEFELYAQVPQNAKTIGLWLRGTAAQNVCVCRNRFNGGTFYMGGNDVTAAGIRTEFADNNTFVKPFVQNDTVNISGAGLYRQPSLSKLNFPQENVFVAPALKGGVTIGTASAGTVGIDFYPGYAVSDGEPVPTAVGKEVGYSPTSTFGFLEYRAYAPGVTAGKFTGYAGTTPIFAIGRNANNGIRYEAFSGHEFNVGAAGTVDAGALVLTIDSNKHLRTTSTAAPALTSCGTGSPAITGTDVAGTVTMGTNATGCVITFNVAYSSAPNCTVTWQNTPLASQSYAISASAITLTQTSTSGNKANYVCLAQTGG